MFTDLFIEPLLWATSNVIVLVNVLIVILYVGKFTIGFLTVVSETKGVSNTGFLHHLSSY